MNNEFQKYCDSLAKTLKEKNIRYGNSTRDTFDKYGLTSYLIRLEDKMNRLRTLVQNEDLDQLDESIEDTFTDLAGYCMLALRDIDNKVSEKNAE